MSTKNDMQYNLRKFEGLLDEVEEATFKKPILSPRNERIEQLQRAARETHDALDEASKFCEAHDAFKQLREHLIFFARSFEVFEGDLLNQPQLFYANIDQCVQS